jgi:hypothetical protein
MLFFKLMVDLSESMVHAILWELWRLHERGDVSTMPGVCHHDTVRYPNQYQLPKATARPFGGSMYHIMQQRHGLTAHRSSG